MSSSDAQFMTVAGLRKLASDYRRNADQCQQVATFLSSQNGSLFWQSQAATTFKQNMSEYMTQLRQFQADFTALARELDNRAGIMEQTRNV